MNKQTLKEASAEYIANCNNEKLNKTFGEYKEKSIHAILKCYFEKDINNREVKVGNFYADIKNEKGIFEIQTRSFDKLRRKIDYYLSNDFEVYIVMPLIKNKTITWIGSVNLKDKSRKSPYHASCFTPFQELYKIKMYLKNKNLHFIFVYLNIHELKNLDGWDKTKKKHSSSYDKYPININNILYINNINDYRKLLPVINGEFTSKKLANITKSKIKDVRVALNILYYLGIVQRVGKIGQAYNYKIVDDIC